MGKRPLRQYYDGVDVEVDPELPLVEPWLRHRRRLLASLRALDEEQWKAPTRCSSWDVRGVVGHLIAVDGFWLMVLGAARARRDPTTFIRGFDPSTGTDDLVAATLELPTPTILDQMAAGTDALVALVESFERDDWSALGEAPFGHLPARLLLAHAVWDSWLHERDIFVPLGPAPPIEPDEVLVATWYTLLFGALQGGLVGDDAPVGPGPGAPIAVELHFTDLPDDPLGIEIGSGVRITRGSGEDAIAAGSAVELVERLTGRRPAESIDGLPADLTAQLERAAQIL